MTKAPVGKRVIAYIIDMVLIMAVVGVFLVGGVVATMVLAWMLGDIGGLAGLLVIPLNLLIFAVAAGYGLLRDGMFGGRSIGKKLMGLKVVASGKPAGFKDSLLRNITMVVPLLNIIDLILGLTDAEGMRIGDKIAHTQVVEA